MSVHNDDDYNAANASFWELENYKRTVRRAEDGSRLCDELMKLIHDRAAIEKDYANKLRGWSKTWSDKIDKGQSVSAGDAVQSGPAGAGVTCVSPTWCVCVFVHPLGR